MDLWIRSQDKMVLTRNVGTRIVLEQEGASVVDETNDYILEMYNTEERALEVLDEIQDNLIMTHTTNIAGYNNVVFYSMPEE